VQDVILASSLSWKTMIVILGSIIDPVIAAYVHRGVWGAKEGRTFFDFQTNFYTRFHFFV